MKKTVFVGLSGGVDSAVSAALLLQQGYNVVGAFIKIWSPEFLECTWKEDRLDAMRVCAALQIPFREIDLSQEYKDEVVRNMVEGYARGVTPNPDVLCNRSIKFGHFSTWAFDNGADYVATGHYARIRHTDRGYELLRGVDPNKDQSYFLYRLGQQDLARTLFPVGAYTKPHIRALAKKFGLPNAERPDSQGLCFVGDVSLKDFLARFIELRRGDVVDRDGRTIGTHDGAALYTIGERRGFTTSSGVVQYVVGIDIKHNLVRVSPERNDASCVSAKLSDAHWISQQPDLPFHTQAQARYREKPFSASLEHAEGSIVANFDTSHIVAQGQSLVFYDGETCIGGGVIG